MNAKNGEYLIAAPPGTYSLEVNEAGIEPYKITIHIKDKNMSQSNIIKQDLFLKKE